jgi:hypothetical protein
MVIMLVEWFGVWVATGVALVVGLLFGFWSWGEPDVAKVEKRDVKQERLVQEIPELSKLQAEAVLLLEKGNDKKIDAIEKALAPIGPQVAEKPFEELFQCKRVRLTSADPQKGGLVQTDEQTRPSLDDSLLETGKDDVVMTNVRESRQVDQKSLWDDGNGRMPEIPLPGEGAYPPLTWIIDMGTTSTKSGPPDTPWNSIQPTIVVEQQVGSS